MPSFAHHRPSGPPPASADASCWAVSGRRGHDPRPGCPATVDLDAPGSGVVLGDAAVHEHVLGVQLQPSWRLADHWARGADVTAIYESHDSRHLRATAMWRLQPCTDGARGWQAIISTQTSLLHSDSILAVTSTLRCDPGDTWLWGRCGDGTVHWQATADADATCVFLRRTGANATSVLVAAHPDEVDRLDARAHQGRATVTCWLFAAALEKGVLLRSRVLAAVGSAREDESWATAAAAEFAALPPMLTT